MSAYQQKRKENEYELKIRGQLTTGTADELRARLTKCLRDNTPIDETVVASLSVDSELNICEGAFEEISKFLDTEYTGDYTDVVGQRYQTRVWHYYQRLCRIPVDETEVDDVAKRNNLSTKFKALVDEIDFAVKGAAAALTGTLTQPSTAITTTIGPSPVQMTAPLAALSLVAPTTTSATVTWATPTHTAAAFNMASDSSQTRVYKDTHSYTRSVPVYKWGITFDGRSQSVGSFLQRVEELRRARGVTTGELFNTAVDLFSGSALVWYRSTLGRIQSWEELCKDMEIVFQSPDHDIRLQQEIFNRVQGEDEPIDLFIAAMEGLYGRLARSVPEEVRLEQISHNLTPQLQDRLALFDVSTIEQLRTLGRKAEAGRFRAIPGQRGAVRRSDVVEPDLAYTPTRGRQDRQNNRADPNRLVFQTTSAADVTCYRCHEKGHYSRDCTKTMATAASRFPTDNNCWNCGKPGHRRRDCRSTGSQHRFNRPSGNEAGPSGVAATRPRQ